MARLRRPIAPELTPTTLEPELVLGAKTLRGCLVNRLIDVCEDAQLHQVGNQLERLLIQPFSQVADNDWRLEGDEFAGGRGNKFGRRQSGSKRGGRFGRRSLRNRGDGLSASGFGGRQRCRWFGRQFERAGFGDKRLVFAGGNQFLHACGSHVAATVELIAKSRRQQNRDELVLRDVLQ